MDGILWVGLGEAVPYTDQFEDFICQFGDVWTGEVVCSPESRGSKNIKENHRESMQFKDTTVKEY